MPDGELLLLLEQAAQRGAELALERVGLGDDDAGADVRDLRTLIDGWRSAKKTMLDQIIRWSIIGFLTVMAGALYAAYLVKR